jgi:hypothetical protein
MIVLEDLVADTMYELERLADFLALSLEFSKVFELCHIWTTSGTNVEK